MSNVITRETQIQAMGLENHNGAIRELILNSPMHKEARQLSRLNAVMGIIDNVGNHIDNDPISFKYGILSALLELIGSGGTDDLGTNFGGVSERNPLFRDLGQGRRHAADGPMWDKSIRSAIDKWLTDNLHVSHGTHEIPKWEFELHYKVAEDGEGEIHLVAHVGGGDPRTTVVYWWDQYTVEGSLDTLMSKEVGEVPSLKAFFGQVILAVEKDDKHHQHIPLIHSDWVETNGGRATGYPGGGIKLDRSLFTEEATKLLDLQFEYYSSQV